MRRSRPDSRLIFTKRETNVTKNEAKHEAELTGRSWESDRARKRRLRVERERAAVQATNGHKLLAAAAAFVIRDDIARNRTRYGRIEPARGDGGKVDRFEQPCITYNESARTLLGY